MEISRDNRSFIVRGDESMQTKNKTNLKHSKDGSHIQLPNDKIVACIDKASYVNLMQQADNVDVTINHLENIFTDETYYLAMKIVPLLERKVLYLAYVENVRLNDICRRLKLQKKEAIRLRSKGIEHFKNNLATIYKVQKVSKGGGRK